MIVSEVELDESYNAALSARQATKDLVKCAIKYVEGANSTTQDLLQFCSSLNQMSHSPWLKNFQHIADVTKHLRAVGTTLVSINQAHTEMLNSLTKNVIGPLKNFTDYDFLEIQNQKKKVSGNPEEIVVPQSKRRTIVGGKGKGFDPAQYEKELERIKKEKEKDNELFVTILDQTHQKKESKLLTYLLEMVKIHYEYHDTSLQVLAHFKETKIENIEFEIEQSSKKYEKKSKEGNLLHKTSAASAAMHGGWQKLYFVLKDGYLNSYKGKKEVIQTINVMVCTPRIPLSLKNSSCFEIVTPDRKKAILLQAESEAERDDWISAINKSIEEQLNKNEPAHSAISNAFKSDDSLIYNFLQSIPGNHVCADCSSPEPDWASINLGILVCLECSGVHRNLGTHISKVRSTILDTKAWEPELLYFMQQIGNEKFNEIFEKELEASEKITPTVDRAAREKFIRAKYDAKLYRETSHKSPDQLADDIYQIVCDMKTSAKTATILKLISQGANLEWRNPNDGFKTCLHCAVIFNQLGYLELLIQNGVSVFSGDEIDWTPMHYAASYHRTACASILYRCGFSGSKQLECRDTSNRTAIEIALKGHADDIVGLLSGEIKDISIGFTIEDLSDPEFNIQSKIGALDPHYRPPPSTRPLPTAPGSVSSAPSLPSHKATSSPTYSPTNTIPLNLPGTSNTAEFQRARLLSLPAKMLPFDIEEYRHNNSGSNRGKGRGRGSGLGQTMMVERSPNPPPSLPPKPSHLFKSLN